MQLNNNTPRNDLDPVLASFQLWLLDRIRRPKPALRACLCRLGERGVSSWIIRYSVTRWPTSSLILGRSISSYGIRTLIRETTIRSWI